MSVDEVVENFLRYKDFYADGGITISGGEPLLQIDFIISLFKELKKLNIHTAIETQGTLFKDNEKFSELIALTDLFIIDLKGVDNEEARKISGVKIDNTFKLLDKLDKENKKFWLTYVLIPGINNLDIHAMKLAKILKQYSPSNCTFKALKYHKLGLEKWEKLGLKNELIDVPIATNTDINNFLTKIKENMENLA